VKLLTKEILTRLPRLYSQEHVKDPAVPVKFFNPVGSWTWYVLEGEPEGEDFRFFGYVHGLEDELGYFMLSELESIKSTAYGGIGLGIERDLHWDPTTKLSEVKSGARR
jgi:hypothetical protein